MRSVSETNIPQTVCVGIMSDKKISFILNGVFFCRKKDTDNETIEVSGEQEATVSGDSMVWNGENFSEIEFSSKHPDSTFTLEDVAIGKQFHWERKEQETFRGILRIIFENGTLTAINDINIEDYLTSVISSEMSATSSLEYLRTQAVVSRSWLMRILLHRKEAIQKPSIHEKSCIANAPKDKETTDSVLKNNHIKWYENDSHKNFDVCADDHCQRYEGITRAQSDRVREAVMSTRGEVLTFGGNVCDARFSKCCGGITESFSTCWDNHDEEYLSPVYDKAENPENACANPNLTVESEARKWIMTSPEAFCNTRDEKILSQVLNDYDFETKDFYRWHVIYTQDELSSLVSGKLNVDFGKIIDLVPLKRGHSGRIIELRIHGEKRTITIGKELEIRRALSPSHLMSSAFVVERLDLSDNGIPSRFKITGAGWGHGVGMCQIGAAVMAAKGHDYKTILKHYYKNSEITKIYE